MLSVFNQRKQEVVVMFTESVVLLISYSHRSSFMISAAKVENKTQLLMVLGKTHQNNIQI